MKRIFSFQNIFSVSLLAVLSYFAVKLNHIDMKTEQLARPAKLFSINNVQSRFAHDPRWDVSCSPDLDSFFYVVSQQQFNWLGRGAQALAFESQDGQYVLKLFQLDRIRADHEPRSFWKKLFSKDSDEKRLERVRHREEIFSSSKQCFEELRDETGIVYVHLNRTNDKVKGIKLIDSFGQSHRIRGDDACFVLQKKASYLVPVLTKLMKSGQIDEAKERVDQILDLLLTMAEKGYVDNDDALIRNNNLGFTDDRAIYIDTGHLVKFDKVDVADRMRYEFSVRLEPLEKWLGMTFPELADYYRDQRNAILASLSAGS